VLVINTNIAIIAIMLLTRPSNLDIIINTMNLTRIWFIITTVLNTIILDINNLPTITTIAVLCNVLVINTNTAINISML